MGRTDMRSSRIRLFTAGLLGLLLPPGAAQAQQSAAPPSSAPAGPPQRPDGAEYWTPSENRMTFIAAGISFPRRAGAVSFNRSIAFGRQNTGLDNGLIYGSDDNALIASAYVYMRASPTAVSPRWSASTRCASSPALACGRLGAELSPQAGGTV
jgi:hypothetical protein